MPVSLEDALKNMAVIDAISRWGSGQVGDAQKLSSLIKVLGELIGHCGLDLILPRNRLLARNNFRVVRHLTAILGDSDNPRQPLASEGYPVTTTWSAKGQVKRSLGKELEQPEFD